MNRFLQLWAESAVTSLGFFWMAFWAFALGYFVSSAIQVYVTRERMRKSMGASGSKSVGLATFFGFISSSCSFAALSTTRALFAKGAGIIPSLAFLLASTNLVIELGIVISLFLSWQFVVGEYVGGILLILFMAIALKLTASSNLIETARKKAKEPSAEDSSEGGEKPNRIKRTSAQYFSEWLMVWKDVTIGFTIAGAIAAFVPRSFFTSLFIGSGSGDLSFWEVLIQCIVGPAAAFLTFIGSMGNIPLAAVLFDNGVAFAGVMAFIFSDLVVLPVLRIQAKYYGWKMALYILGVFLVVLVAASLLMHYSFLALDILPEASTGKSITERDFFAFDYTFFLNSGFLMLSAVAYYLMPKKDRSSSRSIPKDPLFYIAALAFFWLSGGVAVHFLI